mmetsp:Transcript_5991/g.7823  ORF Transcript_5991/g.7823 Transcript_5991/m.7823 type:complete len:645 (-) Transcript_5991:73-2007(-)
MSETNVAVLPAANMQQSAVEKGENPRKIGILRLKSGHELCWTFHGAPEGENQSKNSERDSGRPTKKRRRGQNKKRKLKDLGLQQRQPFNERLCLQIAQGKECPHKEKCKFSHDLKSYWEKREKDCLKTCPFFGKHGKCPYGVKCLAGSQHTKLDSDGIPHQVDETDGKPPLKILNEISIDAKIALRKKKYEYDAGFLETLDERPKIDFRNKIFVAPLTTVGNLPFRRVIKEFGADITCGEMAMARSLLEARNSEWALVKRHESEDVFGIQLADSDPRILGKCVTMLAKEVKVDFIDLNCGCPIDLVTDHGAGSALMNRVKKLREIADEMTSATKGRLPIGIKMRMGWNTRKPNAHKFVPLIQSWRSQLQYGDAISYVSIHGRSRQQRYTKVADWDYIHKCCARASCKSYLEQKENSKPVPVLGNGDILSYTDWEKQMQRRSEWMAYLEELEEEEITKLRNEHQRLGVEFVEPTSDSRKAASELGLDANSQLSACMLARGALLKPWLPTEIKEKRHWDISSKERLEMMKKFTDYGLEHWGSDRKGVDTTRRFFLEWMSFLHRYIPVGLIEAQYVPQHINDRPPRFQGRDDLETMMGSTAVQDWVKISEMLLGPVVDNFSFQPKHKANSYETPSQELIDSLAAGKP